MYVTDVELRDIGEQNAQDYNVLDVERKDMNGIDVWNSLYRQNPERKRRL